MKRSALVAMVFLMQSAATTFAQTWPPQNNGGLPDLYIDEPRLVQSMDIVTQNFSKSSCALVEGSIGAAAARRLLRFDVAIVNGGDGDLIVGDPADPNNPYHALFVYSLCHKHYHITGFTDYQLLDGSRNPVAYGHKQAFCLEDVERKIGNGASHGYTCTNQGITVGWADVYSKYLSGQWVDITDVPEGVYTLHVEVNAADDFREGANRYSNVYETPVAIPAATRRKK